MKTILALSMILIGMNAMAANPKGAFSQGLTDIVQALPGDPTGADLYCSSASGKTALFAALPGDLNMTGVLIKLNDVVTVDADRAYVDNAGQRGLILENEIKNLNITRVVQGLSEKFDLASKNFTLKEISGTHRSKITDGGATGVVHFDAMLSTRGMKNIRVSCVQDWAI